MFRSFFSRFHIDTRDAGMPYADIPFRRPETYRRPRRDA